MNRRKQIRMKKVQNWGFGDDSNNKVLNKNESRTIRHKEYSERRKLPTEQIKNLELFNSIIRVYI